MPASEKPERSEDRRRGRVIGLALVLAGGGLSAAAGWTLRERETRAIGEVFAARVDTRAIELRHAVERRLASLQQFKELVGAAGELDRTTFRELARRHLERRLEATALAWVPRVPHADRARYEAAARQEGLAAFRFLELRQGRPTLAVEREEYFPLYAVEPPGGDGMPLGTDLAADGERRRLLARARDQDLLLAAAPVVPEPGRPAVLRIFAPLFRGDAATVVERRRHLAGFLAGDYPLASLVSVARDDPATPHPEADLRLVDETDPGLEQVLHAAGEIPGDGATRRSIAVAGRRWTLLASPTARYVAERRTWVPAAAFALGLLLTAALVAHDRARSGRAGDVARLVDRRTQELVDTNRRLDEQKSILQSVLDNLGDGVAVADTRGRLTLFNPAAERILGLGRIDSGPQEWSEVYGLYRPDQETPVPSDELPLARAIAGLESRDVELFVRNTKRQDGVFIRVTATPIVDEHGATVGGVAVFRDIGERKWAEALLRDSAARFQAIVEATASALIILSPDQRIREFNPRAERVFGIERAEALGRDFLELCIPAEYRVAVAADLRRVQGGEATLGFEIPVPARDRAERTLLWSFSRAEAGEGRSILIATGHDITERRQAEQARRVRELASHLQSAREIERTRVAREIHDELGQALTGLKLQVSYLGRRIGDEPARVRQQIDEIVGTIDATVASVRRIAADLRPQILDGLGLIEAIRWQAREFEGRTRIPCTIELPAEPVACRPDLATAMFRILQEALTNVARHAGATRVSVRVTRAEDRLVLEVGDDGRGITEDEAANGRSFGLLGMEERAREFGGVLYVRAVEPRGTTVVVSMPC